MKRDKILHKTKNIYFSGICGVSMSGIAKHLKNAGFNVSGSDIALKNGTSDIDLRGIKLYNNHDKNNLKGIDTLVYTSAIDEGNPELIYARQNQKQVVKRSEILGEILSGYKNTIAVSGSHGKTTATALISNIFINANLDPTVFLGGFSKEFGNYRCGNSSFAIAEACEYKKNFLDLKSKVSVILNIDNDHLDCYADIKEIIKAFNDFSKESIAVINADDINCTKIESLTSVTFSIKNLSNYMAKDIVFNGEGYSFNVIAYGIKLGRINLKIKGYHNIYNVLSAIAVSQIYNIPFSVQKETIESFCGVKRRSEYLGKIFSLDIYADYAHHPKEIVAMQNTFNNLNKRYLTIFQPHTYSRTRLLMKDFVNCFNNDNLLILYKTYPAREKYDKRGSAKTLYKNLLKINKKGVFYTNTKQGLIELIKSQENTIDFVLFLGAGDIYYLAKSIAEKTQN